jgi:hypothetical protein
MDLKALLRMVLTLTKQKPSNDEPKQPEIVPEKPLSVEAHATLQPAADSILRPAETVKVSRSVVTVGFSKYGGIEVREINPDNGEILARKPHGSARQTVAEGLARWVRGAR